LLATAVPLAVFTVTVASPETCGRLRVDVTVPSSPIDKVDS